MCVCVCVCVRVCVCERDNAFGTDFDIFSRRLRNLDKSINLESSSPREGSPGLTLYTYLYANTF